MNTPWSMDEDGRRLTTDEVRAWLRKVTFDRDLAGQYWGQLVEIDRGLNLVVPLRWAVCLAHRDGIMAVPEIWGSLHDALRMQMILLEDGELRQLVNEIIDSALESYGKPDDGYWTIRDRDTGRILTKDEAAKRIIGHIHTGDRPDLMARLADEFDDIKVLMAAVPLASESATEELVRKVVDDVMAQGYSEAQEGDWVTWERGD